MYFWNMQAPAFAALREGTERVAQAQQKGISRISIGIYQPLATAFCRIRKNAFALGNWCSSTFSFRPKRVIDESVSCESAIGFSGWTFRRSGSPMSGLFVPALYFLNKWRFTVRPNHPLLTKEKLQNQRLLPISPLLLPAKGSLLPPYVDRVFIAQGVSTLTIGTDHLLRLIA